METHDVHGRGPAGEDEILEATEYRQPSIIANAVQVEDVEHPTDLESYTDDNTGAVVLGYN